MFVGRVKGGENGSLPCPGLDPSVAVGREQWQPIAGTDGPNLIAGEVEFFRRFRDKIKNEYQNEKVVVLGPIAPKVAKISSNYRERIIIKCRNSKNFRKLTAECLKEFSTIKGYNNVAVYCDMNPESLY